MKIKNVNFNKLKKITKVKLFAVGLISVVFLSGCSVNLNNKNNDLNNNDSDYLEEVVDDKMKEIKKNISKGDIVTINFNFINTECINNHDFIYSIDEDNSVYSMLNVYKTETSETFQVPVKKFNIVSDYVGVIEIDATGYDEINVTIDYLEKTIKVEEQLSVEKIK